MHDASPLRPRLFVTVAALFAAFAGAAAADDEPSWFAERFGGRIERVAVGPDGTIYVAGRTMAPNLPASTSAPEPQVDRGASKGLFFAAALERDGRPRWTSYVVGEARDYYAAVRGLAVAADGSVWITGSGEVAAVGVFLPQHDGIDYDDLIVAKFAPDGALLFASDLGGAGYDRVTGIAVAANGDAILTGTTSSEDFPAAPFESDRAPWLSDAFVARIRDDGSEIVWARRFGHEAGGTDFVSGGVAVDPLNDTIVVGMSGAPNQGHAPLATDLRLPRGIGTGRSYTELGGPLVVRLDPSGVQTEGALLLGLGASWGSMTVPVNVGADRSVIVGGRFGVARTTPELFLAVTGWWTRDWRLGPSASVARICTDAAGRVVIGERTDSYPNPLRIVVRERALVDGEEFVDRATELGFAPADIAVDADGSLLVVGTGSGVSFRAPYDAPGPATGCIARVPLDGIRAPMRFRARVSGTRNADLVWSRDGDAASGFDIERVPRDASPVVVGHVAGDVFRYRATGLTPGANHDLRVVAVFASGVRSASPVRSVLTPPEAPIEVVATDAPGRLVDLRLDDPNGDAVGWQVQRRFGDGEWMETGRYPPYQGRPVGEWIHATSTTDVIPDVAVPVRYRVRAAQGRRRTAWTESPPFVPHSTMRVTQTSGHQGVTTEPGGEFRVAGTLQPAEGSPPLSFDPSAQDLRVLYGTAAAPAEFVIPRGFLGWFATDGVLRWSAAESLSGWADGSEIVLDLARGEFLVRLVGIGEQWVSTTQVAVNLEFGEFSGGDVKTWRGRTGGDAQLSFGESYSTRSPAETR